MTKTNIHIISYSIVCMNLRLLFYMNPLVVDKVSKKFLWEKDSGFLYTKQLIDKLPLDWRITILTPKGFDGSFWGNQHHRIIKNIEYDYSTSIHQNRYHFNRNILAKAFPYGTDIDVVINMQPETTENIKVFFQNQRREKPIIINFFHWIDCKESRKFANGLGGFIWRQVEGARSSNLNLFHTSYAFDLFHTSAKENNLPIDNIKIDYFSPQPTIFGTKPIKLPKNKIILFNHRLNNTTGWREVVLACKKLKEEGHDFVLWITDDQNLKNMEDLKQYNWIIIQRVPYESYGYLIKNSHFSVCNTKEYTTWNMAVLDSKINGCVPLVPATDLFNTMFGGKVPTNYGGLYQNIKVLLNNTKQENDRYLVSLDIEKDNSIVPFIEKTIHDRVKNKTIKKYDDVVTYIKNNNMCLKKKFINNFWSFHANSNFQLIRWKLLTNDFKDDITNEETTYLIN